MNDQKIVSREHHDHLFSQTPDLEHLPADKVFNRGCDCPEQKRAVEPD